MEEIERECPKCVKPITITIDVDSHIKMIRIENISIRILDNMRVVCQCKKGHDFYVTIKNIRNYFEINIFFTNTKN